MIKAQTVTSVILWGPPGVGKTTLARLLAANSNMNFMQTSAVFSGVKELREIFDDAKKHHDKVSTLLFVDEIHRFNRSQQDSFLPFIEDGTIRLIGATTENPSFELNSALLSRTQVLTLRPLTSKGLATILARAEAHMGQSLPITDEARQKLFELADGDGRTLINFAEQIWRQNPPRPLTLGQLSSSLAQKLAQFDKSGDWHYNLLSALHKSVRGSDPDASLYWLARLLDGGEDPRIIARRMTRMATEDIGLSDPQALSVSLAAWECFERLGTPEGELALAQAIIYLALAPKSNAVYRAFDAAMGEAKSTGSLPPPRHILNAPTRLMREMDYGKGYRYDHDEPDAFSGQNYFPDSMTKTNRPPYFDPVERGFERDLKKRLAYFAKLRCQRSS